MRVLRFFTAFSAGYLLGTVPSADGVTRLVAGRRVDLREPAAGIPALSTSSASSDARPAARSSSRTSRKGSPPAPAAGRWPVTRARTSVAPRRSSDTATRCGTAFEAERASRPASASACTPSRRRRPSISRSGSASRACRACAGRGLPPPSCPQTVWLLASVLWWRRRLPNSWGPEPTAALPIANAATVLVIASRFARAHVLRHPDELQPQR